MLIKTTITGDYYNRCLFRVYHIWTHSFAFFLVPCLSFQLKFHLSKEHPSVFTFVRIFAQQVVNHTLISRSAAFWHKCVEYQGGC